MKSDKKQSFDQLKLKDQSQIDENEENKIFPQIEILDQLINLLPKRIKKNERPFEFDKESLENIAAQESILDANLQRLKPINIDALKFPGEVGLEQQEKKFEKMLDKIILFHPGIDQSNILRMKYDVNIPYEIQREFNVHYKGYNQGTEPIKDDDKKHEELLVQRNLLQMKPRPDSDYLYSLVCQERLRQFQVRSTNEYYLYTDVNPTTNDIDKRAEILAKLFCKYNLKDELNKVKQKQEQEMIMKQNQKVQMMIIQKTLSGNVVTKDDIQKAHDAVQKEQLNNSTKDIRDAKKKKNGKSKNSMNQDDDDDDNEDGDEGNKSDGTPNNANSLSAQQQQQQKANDQQLSAYQIQENLLNGGSQVLYNEQFEIQINEHKLAIENYYKEKLMKLYERGLNERFMKCKYEFEVRKQDIQNITNPEVLLRHLIQIRLLKNIF